MFVGNKLEVQLFGGTILMATIGLKTLAATTLLNL